MCHFFQDNVFASVIRTWRMKLGQKLDRVEMMKSHAGVVEYLPCKYICVVLIKARHMQHTKWIVSRHDSLESTKKYFGFMFPVFLYILSTTRQCELNTICIRSTSLVYRYEIHRLNIHSSHAIDSLREGWYLEANLLKLACKANKKNFFPAHKLEYNTQ